MDVRYKLRCLGYAETDDDIWFANLYFNGLMKVNKISGKIEIIDKFPGYDIYQGWLYSAVCHVDGYLVFVPNTGREIVSYHLKSREFVTTMLDERWLGEKQTYFVSACPYQNYVYMFPAGALCIVRYDITDHTVKYLENPVSNRIAALPDTAYSFYQQFERIDTRIYLPFLELNAVAVFDLENESVDIRYINIEGGCSTIDYVNGNFYLASWRRPEIYCWNEKTEEIKVYKSFPKDFEGERTFFRSYYIDGTLLYFPEICNMIVSFSPETGRIREEKRIESGSTEPLATFFIQKSGEKYCTLIKETEFVKEIIYDDSGLRLIPCWQLNHTYNKTVIDHYFAQYGSYSFFSEEDHGLKEYLEILPVVNEAGEKSKERQYGEMIFKEVKEGDSLHRNNTGREKRV